MSLLRFAFLSTALLMPCKVSAAVKDLVILQNQDIPRLHCISEESLKQEDELKRRLVEKRRAEGQLHAAYAEVMSLPAAQADIALLRADILRRLGRPEAEMWYRALLKTCQAAGAHHGLGLLYGAQSNWIQAVEHFQRAVQLAPTNARFRSDLGYGLLNIGLYVQSEFELDVAIQLAPEDRLAAMNMLLLQMVVGNTQKAEKQITFLQPSRKDFDELLASCRNMVKPREDGQTLCALSF